MKKITLFIILGILAITHTAAAMQFRFEEKMAIERHEVITEDWYAGGELISFYGTALQDVFAMASKAFFWGVIAQDLNLLIGEGEIKGEIGDDLRILANKATVSAKVAGSVMFLGNQLIVQNDANIGSDMVALGKNIYLNGTIQGPVHIKCKQLIINGTIMGDVNADCQSIKLGPQSSILGHLTYSATMRLAPDEVNNVKGTVNWKKSAIKPEGKFLPYNLDSWLFAGKIFYRLTVFAGLLFLGIMIIVLIPKTAEKYVFVLKKHPLASLGWGFLTVIGGPLLIMVFVITIIGIPLAVITGVFYVLMLALAKLGIAFWLGQQLLKADNSQQLKLIIGFVIGFIFITVIGLIPIIGGLINFGIFLLGTGAIWMLRGYGKVNSASGTTIAAQSGDSEKKQEVNPIQSSDSNSVLATESGTWQPSVPAFLQSNVTKKKIRPKTVKKVKKMTRKKTLIVAPKVVRKSVKKTVKKSVKKQMRKK